MPLPSGVYDVPLHRQPVFHHMHDGRPLRNAEDFCSRHIALPVTRAMQRGDAEQVTAVLREFLL
jgi:dTDP-4-amino-4,6-dideoxygalactose transaminase